MSEEVLSKLSEQMAVVLDRTERIEQILMGDAVQNAGIVTRLASVESKVEVRDKAMLKAGGVGAATASLLSALTAVLLRHLGV